MKKHTLIAGALTMVLALSCAGQAEAAWDLKPDGNWQWLEDGRAAEGWIKDKDQWYYLDDNCNMLRGWQQIGGRWFYLETDGSMVKGWQQIGGLWYYFHEDGAMATDWILLDGKWYFLHEGGDMVTGWQDLGGTWYYFYEDGSMAANTVIDGYACNEKGVATRIDAFFRETTWGMTKEEVKQTEKETKLQEDENGNLYGIIRAKDRTVGIGYIFNPEGRFSMGMYTAEELPGAAAGEELKKYEALKKDLIRSYGIPIIDRTGTYAEDAAIQSAGEEGALRNGYTDRSSIWIVGNTLIDLQFYAKQGHLITDLVFGDFSR